MDASALLRRSSSILPIVFVVMLCASLAHAQQAGLGAIEGRVTESGSGDPLPGAAVTVVGTSATTSTQRDGTFRLAAVPAGTHTVVVSYLGRKDATIETTVTPGTPQRLDVKLSTVVEETVSVQAPVELMRGAQERALNQQKTAVNITNVVSSDQIGSFPDRNAAETVQRIPGISITKDQGEGRYVNIRGTDPRLNSMMIDGERIPAPDPLLRQVAVDVVPSEMLQAIEVSKALTADQDGDSIGGSVNLVTKSAPETFHLYGSLGGGYNTMLSDYGQSNVSGTAGRRFAGGKVGAIVSASFSQTNRGNQDVEVTYTGALGLQELNPRYYQVNRKRVGLSTAIDFRQGNDGGMTVRGVYNRFIDDHENRQRVRWAVGNSRVDRELRDRTHVERITSLGVAGQRLFAGSTVLDYHVLGAYSDQDDPLTMTTTFRQTRVSYAPNVSANEIDPDNVQANPQNENPASFTLNNQVRAINFSKDADAVGAVNLRRPLFSSTTATSFLKVGAKVRHKWKGRNRNESTLTSSTPLAMTDFLETEFGSLPSFLDGRYDLRPYLSQDKVANIPNIAPVTSVRNHQRDAEEFDGTEQTTAGYGMVEIYAGPKLLLLPGLRYEYTSADYTGRTVRFGTGGAWLGTDPLPAKGSYGVALPSMHVRYALTRDTNLRAAVTRSIARPNYYDVVPYRAQDDVALTIAMGNQDLQPTRAWNVDLMGEHYLRSVGVISAGVFYKRLEDYIFTFSNPLTLNGSIYQVSQPLNGDNARVAGVEVAVQNQLTFLPRALSGVGVYANYTYTDSSAQLPGHDGRSTLPGQAKHVGNVAASYERFGFSGRVAVNFHGSYVDAVGATSQLDRFYDRNSQLDVSLNQKLTHNIRLYADFLNLNDALLRYYQGVSARVLQEEHYQWWSAFGVKLEF